MHAMLMAPGFDRPVARTPVLVSADFEQDLVGQRQSVCHRAGSSTDVTGLAGCHGARNGGRINVIGADGASSP